MTKWMECRQCGIPLDININVGFCGEDCENYFNKPNKAMIAFFVKEIQERGLNIVQEELRKAEYEVYRSYRSGGKRSVS